MQHWLQELIRHRLPIIYKWFKKLAPLSRCPREVPRQYRGRFVIQRMRKGKFRLNPFQTIFVQRQSAEERRPEAQWMNRGAGVVQKPRQRQFGRPRAAAEGIAAFQQQDRAAGLRQPNARRQAIRAGTDDDRVILFLHAAKLSSAWRGVSPRAGTFQMQAAILYFRMFGSFVLVHWLILFVLGVCALILIGNLLVFRGLTPA